MRRAGVFSVFAELDRLSRRLGPSACRSVSASRIGDGRSVRVTCNNKYILETILIQGISGELDSLLAFVVR